MNILIYTKENCTECARIEGLLDSNGIGYRDIDMKDVAHSKSFELKNIARKNRQVSMPMIFVDGEFVKNTDIMNKLGIEE